MSAKFHLQVIAMAVSIATSCHAFNIGSHSPTRSTLLKTSQLSVSENRRQHSSRLFLFDSLLKKEDSKGSGRQNLRSSSSSSPLHRVPEEEFDFISNGYGLLENNDKVPPPFPYPIDLLPPSNGKKSNQPTRLIIRHLEDDDITNVLPEIVREFGALIQPPPTTPEPGDELATKIENYLFSLTVLIGLTQRVVRRTKGYSTTNSACPDHNVICLVEQTPNNNNIGQIEGAANGVKTSAYTEEIVGIAELSWQPPNPNANAPPFVLPFFMKTLISKYSPSRDGTSSNNEPKGYISNVLVWKNRRGRGYGRVLVAALEGIAKIWGCEDVRLHVDAQEFSGRIARGLYWSMGYEGVPDRGTRMSKSDNMGYDWMGPSMANQGLYLVDGVPLLYLRKQLKDE